MFHVSQDVYTSYYFVCTLMCIVLHIKHSGGMLASTAPRCDFGFSAPLAALHLGTSGTGVQKLVVTSDPGRLPFEHPGQWGALNIIRKATNSSGLVQSKTRVASCMF